MDCQAVLQGKARVAIASLRDRRVSLKLSGKRRESVAEVVEEAEHLVARKSVLHHHKAHEVQTEVPPDRGWLDSLGVVCLGSLCTRRPLMFGFALEFIGPDTPNGREMTRLWQYEEYRRVSRVITTEWGIGFLLEAAARVVIVYDTSTGSALASSKVTPFVWVAVLSAWTVAYGALQKRKGERLVAASETPGTSSADPQ